EIRVVGLEAAVDGQDGDLRPRRRVEGLPPAGALRGDSRIRSTPSSTNEANASIWDFWSRFVAGANFSEKPASSVKVSWMFCSLAWRQAPSGPTATKPMVTGSSAPPLALPDEQAARAVATSPAAL